VRYLNTSKRLAKAHQLLAAGLDLLQQGHLTVARFAN
jgi:hypothetical protein